MQTQQPYESLQDFMAKTGTTQARLAKLVRMPKSQLSQLLSGSRQCSLQRALVLGHVTGVPVEKLVEWPKLPVVRISTRTRKTSAAK